MTKTLRILVDLFIFAGFLTQIIVITMLFSKISGLEADKKLLYQVNRGLIDVCRKSRNK
jgi:hypothetical protein